MDMVMRTVSQAVKALAGVSKSMFFGGLDFAADERLQRCCRWTTDNA